MSTDDSSAADRGSALTEGLGLVGWVARNVYPREIPDPSLMIGDDKEEAEYLAGAYNSIYEIIPVYEQSAIDAAVAAERERWVALCKDFAADNNPPRKDYEDTYCDGWLDACNEIMWSGEKA